MNLYIYGNTLSKTFGDEFFHGAKEPGNCIIVNRKIQITVSPIFRAVRSYLSNGNRDAVVLFESQRLRAII